MTNTLAVVEPEALVDENFFRNRRESLWTRFMDMHSGGGRKTDYDIIYIEARVDRARVIFENRFGRDPDDVTCNCCGPDFSIDPYPWDDAEEHEVESLQQVTAFERSCAFDPETKRYLEEPRNSEYDRNRYVGVDEYARYGAEKWGSRKPFVVYAEDITEDDLDGFATPLDTAFDDAIDAIFTVKEDAHALT